VTPVDNLAFYGYMPLCASKFGPSHGIVKYGQECQVGDLIGVLLEYRLGVASISFYRNSHKLGIAFSDLEGPYKPALCLFYGELTLDPKASIPL
jgi:tripartite motif-containing protein 9/67